MGERLRLQNVFFHSTLEERGLRSLKQFVIPVHSQVLLYDFLSSCVLLLTTVILITFSTK